MVKFDDWWENVGKHGNPFNLRRAFDAGLRLGEMAERERCAALCEAHAGMRSTGAWVALTAAADRIRGLIE